MNVELHLLAVMLQQGNFGPFINDEITEEHFETTEGKLLYEFITTYRDESGTTMYPSLTIVRNRFAKSVIELPDPDPGDTIENLSHELRREKLRSHLRQFAVSAEDIANGPDDPVQMIRPVLTKLRKALEVQERINHLSLATAFQEVIDDYNNGNILPNGVAWPWPLLTDATKGLHRKEFIVLAGRPKARKTFTALRVGVHAFKHSHERLLVFSPEMPPRQMFLRCIAHLADLPYREFKDGSLDPADEARLFEEAERYGRLKDMDDEAYVYHLNERIPGLGDARPSLDVVQSTGRDTTWLASQIEVYNPSIVIFDSFYRQRAPGARRNDVDYKAITALSREIKDLVMSSNIIGIGTHQLNREAERGVGGLGSLALADAIGADADGIYRVVTGKLDGEEVSALFNYGGREVPSEGVLIRNKPCFDYSEIGLIKNRKQVADLMRQEEEEAAKEEGREGGTRTGPTPRGPRRQAKPSGHSASGQKPRGFVNLRPNKMSQQLEEAQREELEELGK